MLRKILAMKQHVNGSATAPNSPAQSTPTLSNSASFRIPSFIRSAPHLLVI